MVKWEYAVQWRLDEEQLNEFGEQGWELVMVVENYFYFKRPLVEKNETTLWNEVQEGGR